MRIILTLLMALSFPLLSHAQYAKDTGHYEKLNIDTDIRDIRNCVIPDFSTDVDTYLQLLPAVTAYGMKAFGYESRTKWYGMLVSDAIGGGITLSASYALKYTVKRMRPDGSEMTSFPSGHSARAFASAAILSKEYGWRSPWFSIGGYTVAAATAVMRVMNDRHWMSDIAAGAALGIGSVELGYFIADKIFRDRHLTDSYLKPEFIYDASAKHYTAEMFFSRRFILAGKDSMNSGDMPYRGGTSGLQTDIPVIPGTGATGRLSASSLRYKDGKVMPVYAATAGGYWNRHFAKIMEFQIRAAAGCAWNRSYCGADISTGVSLGLITGNNFKVKGFAEYETMSGFNEGRWLNSITAGYSVGWFW